MCPPLVLAGIAIAVSAASAGLSYMQQSKQADRQEAAVNENYNQQMETYKVQQGQEQKSATDEMSARARQSMIESSRLKAVSGESGLAGHSIDRAQNESQFNLGTDLTSIENNRMSTQKQLYQNAMGIRGSANSQLAQIVHPSLIGTGLQIAGDAAGIASNYQQTKAFRGMVLPPMASTALPAGK